VRIRRPGDGADVDDRAAATGSAESRPLYLARRASQLLAAGDVTGALAVADGVTPTQPAAMAVLAKVYAAVPTDRDRHTEKCLKLLKQAADAGHFHTPASRAELLSPEFAGVRGRPGFPTQ
jgi:hypothetical protein